MGGLGVGNVSGRVSKLLQQGRAHQAQGRTNQGFACYQQALQEQPQHPEALHLMGMAYVAMGMAVLGVPLVHQAIALEPAAIAYRLELAQVLVQQGQTGEACMVLEAACAVEPASPQALAQLGDLQIQLNRYAEAERSYAAAVALDGQQALWHEALAQLQHQRWALPEAQASRQRALALGDAPTALRLNLGYAEPRAPRPVPPPLEQLRAAPGVDLATACQERDLLVIDDFLDDPLAFRAQALALCRQRTQLLANGVFPGVQTAAQPMDAAMQRIADALGRTVKWDSPDHGALRVSLATDEARADVHVDSPTLPHIFGGVLYLSLPEDCQGGTSFYRHRATGLARRPEAADVQAGGFASLLDFQKRHLPPNKLQPFAQWRAQREGRWEWLFEVPMRFNRLVVFRSDYFHAVSELFGNQPENGRLVQLFHFQTTS
ncbi:hypothetical protein os1_24890 [Comamonadaceae bacterium OS-1]|nr:hypothetical protein os1_24890 [Comamonadaceae bacterium OS-1]